MYVPRHFSQDDTAFVHDLIRSNVFATLITELSGRLDATHMPVVLDSERGEKGSLRFHLARANPTSKALTDGREVLLVFVGPNTYISPDWYANENLVPTWNYAVVHAYGVPSVLDDAGLRRLLDDLSASQENQLPKTPWTTDKMPPDLVDKMCKAIIGFDFPITELVGKWKFNQNRGADDRTGVVAALDELGGESKRAVASIMRSGE
ncbi:MAG: FMN-binding negative transcriptional regulator [Lysobacterales bacterium]|nr:MAG: FMN-binding negative transcriptional regulator [Xanthomonadales bacterium]